MTGNTEPPEPTRPRAAAPLPSTQSMPGSKAPSIPRTSVGSSLAETFPGLDRIGDYVLFSSYLLMRQAGKGAMGHVFEAWKVASKRRVAIKMVAQNVSDDRFFDEAAFAIQDLGPHVVRAWHFDRGPTGQNYIEMEWVEGATLTQLGKERRLSDAELVTIGIDLCRGLEAIHAKGAVHRDMKPDNVLINTRGTAKIADLGIAKIRDAFHDQTIGSPRTPKFMSPEQALAGHVDFRSDIFSLGGTLYALADNDFASSRSTVLTSLVSAGDFKQRLWNIDVSPEFKAVLYKCLSREPEDRWASAAELRGALEAIGWDEQRALPAPRQNPPPDPTRAQQKRAVHIMQGKTISDEPWEDEDQELTVPFEPDLQETERPIPSPLKLVQLESGSSETGRSAPRSTPGPPRAQGDSTSRPPRRWLGVGLAVAAVVAIWAAVQHGEEPPSQGETDRKSASLGNLPTGGELPQGAARNDGGTAAGSTQGGDAQANAGLKATGKEPESTGPDAPAAGEASRGDGLQGGGVQSKPIPQEQPEDPMTLPGTEQDPQDNVDSAPKVDRTENRPDPKVDEVAPPADGPELAGFEIRTFGEDEPVPVYRPVLLPPFDQELLLKQLEFVRVPGAEGRMVCRYELTRQVAAELGYDPPALSVGVRQPLHPASFVNGPVALQVVEALNKKRPPGATFKFAVPSDEDYKDWNAQWSGLGGPTTIARKLKEEVTPTRAVKAGVAPPTVQQDPVVLSETELLSVMRLERLELATESFPTGFPLAGFLGNARELAFLKPEEGAEPGAPRGWVFMNGASDDFKTGDIALGFRPPGKKGPREFDGVRLLIKYAE